MKNIIRKIFWAFLLLGFSPAMYAQQSQGIFPLSPVWQPIPDHAVYTLEPRIGSFRMTLENWECPVYRVYPGQVVPLVKSVVTSSGRTAYWPIPASAKPASGDDKHMCIINYEDGNVYEFWRAVWQADGSIKAGGMVKFPLNGTGISNPPNFRVTASGFSNTTGMIKREDFMNEAGQITLEGRRINHALTMAIPWCLLIKDGYIPPAVGGEIMGCATENGIPLGALFALPKSLNVDALSVPPFVREVLRAARDYGIYIVDGSGSAKYGGKDTGILEIETGLMPLLYGTGTRNDDFSVAMQSAVYNVIATHGLWRVTIPDIPPTPTGIPVTPTGIPTEIPMETFTPTGIPMEPTEIPTEIPTATEIPTEIPTETLEPTGIPTETAVPTQTPTPAQWRIRFVINLDVYIERVEP